MFSYFFVLAAIFTRVLPHPWFSFTAVGASLLVFGARRSPKLFILPVLALAAADYYLTVFAYNYAFHVQDYLVTWAWYLGACWMGYAISSQTGECRSRRGCGARLFHILFSWQVISPSGPARSSIRTQRVAWQPATSSDFRSTATMFWQQRC